LPKDFVFPSGNTIAIECLFTGQFGTIKFLKADGAREATSFFGNLIASGDLEPNGRSPSLATETLDDLAPDGLFVVYQNDMILA